jgi:hypothetical protein
MNYSYQFLKISPKQLLVQVKYSADGKPDLFKNIITGDFTEEGLDRVVKSHAPQMIAQWELIEQAPESVDLVGTVKQVTVKPVVNQAEPDFDPFTQRLEEVITETDTEIQRGWNVVDLTTEEQAQFLSDWRATASVSMRQARLALIEQGFISQVQDAIALIPEPDKSKIEAEWEYASTVERGSVWVATLQPALGLTDEQMDNLFKLAGTL